MTMIETMPAEPLYVGHFVFDPIRGGLFAKDGSLRRLRPKAYKLLSYLVHFPHRMLERAELAREIWPGVHVTEDSLTHLVREVRRAMDDVDGAILQTVPGRGYVFATTIQPAAASASVPLSSMFGGQATSFVGRQRELAEVGEQTRAHRLVTISGMGGIGKTRLLLQLATKLERQSSPHLFWIDLASASDLAEIGLAFASGMGIGLPAGPVDQAVLSMLRHRSCLLLIDNVEHVAVQLGPLVQAVLAGCRDVSLLLTSRVSLGVPGECVYRLDPLPLPPAGESVTAEAAMRFDAVRLFVDRARLLVPSFSLEAAKPEVVAEICRRLDGIALAIEMAVPRLQVLTAEQFLGRLDQRFHLLTARGSAAPARQRSLRHMLEWSWELLWEPDQILLTVLSVFAGSVSLSAIVSMRAVDQFPEWAVLEGLTELVRASLVIAEPGTTEPRFRLLETTRAFALEQLQADAVTALRRRHMQVMIEVFRTAETEWATAETSGWLQRYAPDADNLRSALSWGFGPGRETEAALCLVSLSYPFWWELPSLPLRESRQWFDQAIERIGPDTPADVQARLWLGHSWRDLAIGDLHNCSSAQRAVALLRTQDRPMLLGAALWRQGCSVLLPSTLEEAAMLLDQAIEHLRPVSANKWLALALVRRADVHANNDDFLTALPLYNEAFSMAKHTNYAVALQQAGVGLAELLFRSGARSEGIKLLERLRHEIAGPVRLPLTSILATQLAADDCHVLAMDAIGEVLGNALQTGLAAATARAMETLAMILAQAGETRPAARMLGYVLTIHASTRRRTGGRSVVFNRLDAVLQADLTPSLLHDLLHEGAAWTEEEAFEVATLHYGWMTSSIPAQRCMASNAEAMC